LPYEGYLVLCITIIRQTSTTHTYHFLPASQDKKIMEVDSKGNAFEDAWFEFRPGLKTVWVVIVLLIQSRQML
jgi:hypothetical protein